MYYFVLTMSISVWTAFWKHCLLEYCFVSDLFHCQSYWWDIKNKWKTSKNQIRFLELILCVCSIVKYMTVLLQFIMDPIRHGIYYLRFRFDLRFVPEIGYSKCLNSNLDSKISDPSKPNPNPYILIFGSRYPDSDQCFYNILNF